MLFPESLAQKIGAAGVIAVAVVEKLADARPMAEALLEGGVGILELTLRTPVALEALEVIVGQVPAMLTGAGTVLSPAQVAEVRARGAAFGVAPGTNRRVLEAAGECGLPFAPGVMTPSDIEAALECGALLLKYFPAESAGGVAHLRAIATPYAALGPKFIPLGGIGPETMGVYLREPIVSAVGGSWLTPRSALAARDWKRITRLAADACQSVAKVRAAAV